jgi:amidase
LFQASPNRRGYTCEAQVAAEALNPDDKSLVAERSRGTVLSHRDWIAADRARVGLQQRRFLLGVAA